MASELWTCSIRPCPPRAGPRRHYRGKPLKSEAKFGSDTEAGVRPHNEVVPSESAGVEITLHLYQYAAFINLSDGAGDASRLVCVVCRERVLRVASRISTSGEAIDFRPVKLPGG